jgi:hypothetical protein
MKKRLSIYRYKILLDSYDVPLFFYERDLINLLDRVLLDFDSIDKLSSSELKIYHYILLHNLYFSKGLNESIKEIRINLKLGTSTVCYGLQNLIYFGLVSSKPYFCNSLISKRFNAKKNVIKNQLKILKAA